ncbi:TrmH family RNA methyltransferase [Extensimonas vulgaris]|uniref:TrmH family RNA methyltransferase n=1 Tax=Extensimonas vulgaris TaxID=1031594 RepID=A0A369AMN7_9BURK|nr:RNA methyltransferase [Extensimonas vulgaris]RCX10325.1 TrmH family RNA methyltransferase [Extensimonas vulgaris]TWI39923.1 TrmH family RNA methyltransferase [Extensimonas vulgaris]TXD17459.1 RNA methyltransferase [Extensimonas vulgaris]
MSTEKRPRPPGDLPAPKAAPRSAGKDAAITHIHSRDNAFVKALRRLAQDSTAYRSQGQVWVEGDHLCRAALARGWRPAVAVFSESFWPLAPVEWAQAAHKVVVLSDALFAAVSALESPARMGYVLDLPPAADLQAGVATVVLDRVQDAGNVGSILRSAAAFGFGQVLALKGSAALWSPKVLRAGMGAHFALRLVEGLAQDDVQALALPLLVTSSHAGDFLHEAKLPWPCAWVLGHEGQGVSPALEARAAQRIRIAQPGGEESLNVAAAAAICLHASAVQGHAMPLLHRSK